MSGAVVVLRARQIVNAFHDAGATSRQTSVSLLELGVDDSIVFRQLAGAGVFINTREDCWYIDEAMEQRWRSRFRRRVWVLIGIALVVILVVVTKGS